MKTTKFIIELSESPKADFGKKKFSEQGIEQKVFTAVFGSSGSIFMDGFALYFVNSHGESASFAPEAYRRVGALKSAELIEKASRILTSETVPEDSFARSILGNGLSETERSQLNELDQAFYSTGEIIDELLFDYVKKHPNVFGPVPMNIERHGR